MLQFKQLNHLNTSLVLHKKCVSKWNLPRSRVIPRSLLCGFLSKAAVDAVVLNALAT